MLFLIGKHSAVMASHIFEKKSSKNYFCPPWIWTDLAEKQQLANEKISPLLSLSFTKYSRDYNNVLELLNRVRHKKMNCSGHLLTVFSFLNLFGMLEHILTYDIKYWYMIHQYDFSILVKTVSHVFDPFFYGVRNFAFFAQIKK